MPTILLVPGVQLPEEECLVVAMAASPVEGANDTDSQQDRFNTCLRAHHLLLLLLTCSFLCHLLLLLFALIYHRQADFVVTAQTSGELGSHGARRAASPAMI